MTNKFTFIYTGNMGVTHDFDAVKSLMLHFKNDRNVIIQTIRDICNVGGRINVD